MMIASINRQNTDNTAQVPGIRESEPSSAQSHFTKILFEFEDSVDELDKVKHRRVGS